MPISHKLKVIFIHIPKNAGESIEKTLDIYGLKNKDPKSKYWGVFENKIVLQHLTALQLRNSYIKNSIWDSYFKFAIIRNPWSKAVSEYNWFLRYGPQIKFKEWCESLEYRIKINSMINILETGHNIEQYKFITDNDGNFLVDELIRFENIENGFNNLAQKRSWKALLKNAKTTKNLSKKDWRSYYCKETLNIIEKVYKKDLDIFGYNKEETFKNFII